MALEALRGEKTLVEMAQKHDLHPTQINEWRKQLLERAADVFGADSKPDEPAIDLKELHATIRQLTLEKNFLQGALSKAGLLSARR